MPFYKVTFNDNKASSAESVQISSVDELKEFGNVGDKTVIRWYVVEADTEQQAIDIADKVVKEIWGVILGLN